MLIRMYFADHAPPHFHAIYAEAEALIDIQNLSVIEGQLPRRALAMVLEWAALHRAELLENWTFMCSAQISSSDRSAGLSTPRWRVISVRALPPYRLRVAFQDGTEGEIDLSGLIMGANAGVFEHLRDQALFAAVHIEHGAVSWAGDIDLAPDALYAAITTHSPFPNPDSR